MNRISCIHLNVSSSCTQVGRTRKNIVPCISHGRLICVEFLQHNCVSDDLYYYVRSPTFPASTSALALSFVLFSRAVPSDKQLILARALVSAVLTAVLAKLSRLVASALVGPLTEESVKYALTAFRRSDDGLAVHVFPEDSPA